MHVLAEVVLEVALLVKRRSPRCCYGYAASFLTNDVLLFQICLKALALSQHLIELLSVQ